MESMDEISSPQEGSSIPEPSSDPANSEETCSSQDVQIKKEPEDNGYERHFSSNSRTSSPLPPVHFGNISPLQSNSASPQHGTANESNDLISQDESLPTSNSGSHVQNVNTTKAGKKMSTVQNIVEGLRKKSESQLGRNSSSESELGLINSNKETLEGDLKTNAPTFPPDGQSSIFPISQKLQVRISRKRKDATSQFKKSIARPRSPTGKSQGLLKDLTHFTYSIMESAIDDTEAAEIFNVQNHELVCAIGSKSLVSDKSKKAFASLDFGHYWCNFCPFSSNNKAALIQHVLQHRFSCQYCPYESFCRSDIMRHMHKMHYEFKVTARRYMYCTLLSDYMRVKARVQGETNKDFDEDVGDPDLSLAASSNDPTARKRKHTEDDLHSAKSVRSSLDSPTSTPTLSESEFSLKEKGKSRKSQNPKKHAQPDVVEHFDIFDMEVEKNTHPQLKPSGYSLNVSNKLPLCEQNSASSQFKPPSLGTMQMLPATDGSLQTFTSKRAVDPTIPTTPQPPKANFSYKGRKNVSAGGTSSLYWSCGHCSFQSNGQAEIKEHSSKEHPGKPHRYVALIKNMTPDTYIPHGALNMRKPQNRQTTQTLQTNGAQNSSGSDDVSNSREKEDSPDLYKARVNSPKPPKRETVVYRCYHCSYTARRHSSLKTHLYHKHRGKGLVAVEDESETGQQMFFCARDDCTYKSDNPTLYLNHVEQCTPWNKPELADVEVEPYIRECLDQTIAFAETAREKVNNQCLYNAVAGEGKETACESQQTNIILCVGDDTLSPDCQQKDADATVLPDDPDCSKSQANTDYDIRGSQTLLTSKETINRDKMHECCKTAREPDKSQNAIEATNSRIPPEYTIQAFQSLQSISAGTASCDDSGHVDFVSHTEEDSSFDNLKHSISSQESFIAVGLVDQPDSCQVDMNVEDEGIVTAQENTFISVGVVDRPVSRQVDMNVEDKNIIKAQENTIIVGGVVDQPDSYQVDVNVKDDGIISSEDSAFIAVGVVDRPVSRRVDTRAKDESIVFAQQNTTSLLGKNIFNGCILGDLGNTTISSQNENSDNCVSGNFSFSTASIEETTTNISNEDDLMGSLGKVLSESSKPSDSIILECNSALSLEKGNGGGYSESTLDLVNIVSMLSSTTTHGPLESECLKYLIDSTSDNTDSEENGISSVPSATNTHQRSETVGPQTSLTDKYVTGCKQNDVNSFENYVNSPILTIEKLDEKKTSNGLKQVVSARESSKTTDIHKTSANKLCFTYVPARSSAQKALSKMKSTLTEEGESSSTDTEIKKANTVTEIKRVKPLKIKMSDLKPISKKHLPTFPSQCPYATNTARANLATPCTTMSQPKPVQPIFKCKYCTEVAPGSLKKIKSHLLHKHKNLPPSVINCTNPKRHRKCKFFVCPHHSCFKLFSTVEDLENHKNIHIGPKKTKERRTLKSRRVSSCVHSSGSSLETNVPSLGNLSHSSDISKPISGSNVPSPLTSPELRSCRVELRNLGISEVEAITQRHKREAKYLCLYCTEYVYESSLSAMKSHYIQEHEGQLMVMRDTEARRAQQPSRIYVCSSPGCEFKCVSRHELDTHVRSEHSTSSCSYVYQCALCGWFSSSHVSANQHLESQHSPDEGASLIHMQVMVDKFGQTSKKIV